eukprot:m.118376 g.118376  ORF g.118376 m.118376 type:complete len:102 (+) comp9228_c0_seq4:148-453(+)
MAAAYIRKHLPEMAEKFNPEATFLDLQESHLMKYSKQDLIAILQNPALAIAMYYELHPESSSSDASLTTQSHPPHSSPTFAPPCGASRCRTFSFGTQTSCK